MGIREEAENCKEVGCTLLKVTKRSTANEILLVVNFHESNRFCLTFSVF